MFCADSCILIVFIMFFLTFFIRIKAADIIIYRSGFLFLQCDINVKYLVTHSSLEAFRGAMVPAMWLDFFLLLISCFICSCPWEITRRMFWINHPLCVFKVWTIMTKMTSADVNWLKDKLEDRFRKLWSCKPFPVFSLLKYCVYHTMSFHCRLWTPSCNPFASASFFTL